MATGETPPVHRAGAKLLAALAEFYEVPVPPLGVLGVRPHKVTSGVCTYQLFGDYTPATQRIRVWMRTAIREKVSSPKALLNTLLHEFCHHLDCTRLACPESYHTRGFYTRIDHLYHLALARRRRCADRCAGSSAASVWSVDWRLLAAADARRPAPAEKEAPAADRTLRMGLPGAMRRGPKEAPMVKVGFTSGWKQSPARNRRWRSSSPAGSRWPSRNPRRPSGSRCAWARRRSGFFDAFPSDAGRKAHLNGPIAAALMSKAADLLAKPPQIEQIDVLAAKVPE